MGGGGGVRHWEDGVWSGVWSQGEYGPRGMVLGGGMVPGGLWSGGMVLDGREYGLRGCGPGEWYGSGALWEGNIPPVDGQTRVKTLPSCHFVCFR